MKIFPFLQEEFEITVQKGSVNFNIFNIKKGQSFSQDEMDMLKNLKHIRFMCDYKMNKLHVWDAHLFHIDVAKALRQPYSEADFSKMKYQIWGEALFDNDRIEFVNSINPIEDIKSQMNSIKTLRYVKGFENLNCTVAHNVFGLQEEINKLIKKANTIIKRNKLEGF